MAALGLLLPGSALAGCGCGDYDCSGTMATFTVPPAITAVEVCTNGDDCVREEFGNSSQGIESRSFTMFPPDLSSWQVRVYGDDRVLLSDQVVVPKAPERPTCGCSPPYEFQVLTESPFVYQTNAAD